MVDSAGNMPRYGNQTALRTEDFKQIRDRGQTGRPASAWPERLGQFERVAMAHRGFFATAHH